MYVCMSVTLRNAIINAYAHAYVHSIDVLYLLPRDFSMSERKRQLARLRKQRQRSCMNPDSSDKKQGVISMLQELLKMNKGGDSEY